MLKVTCMCDNVVDFDVHESYDLDEEENVAQAILDGSFLTKRCEKCGKLLKPELPLAVTLKGTSIALVPELERGSYLIGTYKALPASRVAIGYRELVEKVKIVQNLLDDKIIEVIKYHLLKKTENPLQVTLYFDSKNEKGLVFHIYGLKPDEIGISTVPYSVYVKISGESKELFSEEPYSIITEEPYVSVRKITEEE